MSKEYVISIDHVKNLWKDLHDRFVQGDLVRVSDLQEELNNQKQGNYTVIQYFTHIKVLGMNCIIFVQHQYANVLLSVLTMLIQFL